ncbi:hypothetical protein RI054_09g49380 [Pseudoscourfieldia marina]
MPRSANSDMRVAARMLAVLVIAATFTARSSAAYTYTSPRSLRWRSLRNTHQAPARQGPGTASHEAFKRIAENTRARIGADEAAHQLASGQLLDWGIGGSRLARDDPAGNIDEPLPALRTTAVRAVALSGHTLAVLSDGTVVTFGRNNSAGGGGQGSQPIDDSGQLGRGDSFDWWRKDFPRNEGPGPVALGRAPAVGVAAGRYHSAAVDAHGKVYTWGLNDHGQLGRAGVSDTPEGATPRDGFKFGETITTVHGRSGGDGIRCVVGFGCRSGNPAPVELPEDFRAIGISAARYSAVAWDVAGVAYVWGQDGCAGAVSDESQAHIPRKLPLPPTESGDGYAKIDSGYSHWVALTQNGAIVACHTGYDGYGSKLERFQEHQGINWRAVAAATPGSDVFTPQRVLGLERCVDVAAGRGQSWAACGGEALFWGHLPSKVLCERAGDSNAVETHETSEPCVARLPPASHAALVTMVAAGEYFALIYDDANRRVMSLGANGVGQGGNGAAVKPEVATPVAGRLGAGGYTVRRLAAGYQHAAAIVKDTRK